MMNGVSCRVGVFDWRLLDDLKGTWVQGFVCGNVVVEANAVNDCLFRVIEGKVEVKTGNMVFACVSAIDEWPVFCEMSALGIENSEKLTTKSIVAASTPCRIQVIPRETLTQFLFQGTETHDRACLFFETMCRHYTAKLRGVHQRNIHVHSEIQLTSSSNCVMINGEAVIFSTKV
jgi:hypothetical protein